MGYTGGDRENPTYGTVCNGDGHTDLALRDHDLVLDVRFNGGGFIPEMFIEQLIRPHYNTWVPRDGAEGAAKRGA